MIDPPQVQHFGSRPPAVFDDIDIDDLDLTLLPEVSDGTVQYFCDGIECVFPPLELSQPALTADESNATLSMPVYLDLATNDPRFPSAHEPADHNSYENQPWQQSSSQSLSDLVLATHDETLLMPTLAPGPTEQLASIAPTMLPRHGTGEPFRGLLPVLEEAANGYSEAHIDPSSRMTQTYDPMTWLQTMFLEAMEDDISPGLFPPEVGQKDVLSAIQKGSELPRGHFLSSQKMSAGHKAARCAAGSRRKNSKTSSASRPTRDGVKKTSSRIPDSTRRLRSNKNVCRWCKLHKDRCSDRCEKSPCKTCIAKFGTSLAMRICVVYNENAQDYRFVHCQDFYDLRHRVIRAPIRQSLPVEDLIVGHPVQQIRHQAVYFSDAPTLTVRVQKFTRSSCEMAELERLRGPSMQAEFDIMRLMKRTSEPAQSELLHALACQLDIFFHNRSCNDYVILPESLPSTEELIEWAGFDAKSRQELCEGDIEAALDAFLATYKDHSPELAHTDLVRKTLTIASLARMLDNRRPVDHCKHQQMIWQISNTPNGWLAMSYEAFDELRTDAKISGYARDQLRTLAAKAIELEEQHVIPMLDQLVCERPGGDDPLIIGLCLRRLCLVYRRIAARYRRLGQELLQHRRKPYSHMYDALTRHYAAVFRGTLNPFHREWQYEQHRETLGNDDELVRLFEVVKTAEKCHYQEDLDDDDDLVYKRLFIERLDQSHWSIAKEWDRSRDLTADTHDADSHPTTSNSVHCWEMVGSPPKPPPISCHGHSLYDFSIKSETDTDLSSFASRINGSRMGDAEFDEMAPAKRVDTITRLLSDFVPNKDDDRQLQCALLSDIEGLLKKILMPGDRSASAGTGGGE